MRETFLDDRVALHAGDMLAVLPTLAENSIDSCVTDPPYHLTSIVNRFGAENAAPAQFGSDGRYARASAGFMGQQWDGGDVAFRVETWREVLRVLKPGAHLLAFGGTRTYHRMACAIEDAGFEIRDTIMWIYGSGFPKSHNQGNGLGTALKPACEPIILARKPLSEGTVAANVLKWGTGAINIDGCRVECEPITTGQGTSDRIYGGGKGLRPPEMETQVFNSHPNGRWPANVIHDGSDEVTAGFPETGVSSGGNGDDYSPGKNIYNEFAPTRRANAGGLGDSGSAARFFYTSKADSDDRLGSRHPTVKPLDLIQYLVRLVTPHGGLVLDCFAGSGTTGEAAFREGTRAVLIEREDSYCADIRRRMALVLAGPDERAREAIKERMKDKPADHGPLFATREST